MLYSTSEANTLHKKEWLSWFKVKWYNPCIERQHNFARFPPPPTESSSFICNHCCTVPMGRSFLRQSEVSGMVYIRALSISPSKGTPITADTWEQHYQPCLELSRSNSYLAAAQPARNPNPRVINITSCWHWAGLEGWRSHLLAAPPNQGECSKAKNTSATN